MIQLSYRDPDGFLIKRHDKLYRVVFDSYKEEIKAFDNTFFYEFNIPIHKKIDNDIFAKIVDELAYSSGNTFKIQEIYEVEELRLITYPWEWTPSMLLDAGIYTLQMQIRLMGMGFSLKDASFFNIQFVNDRLFFIDILSIKKADNFYPWLSFGQFLRHFTFPAALLKYNRITDLKIFWHNQDGIDISYLKATIPVTSYFNFFEIFHIHLASLLSNKKEAETVDVPDSVKNSTTKLTNLLNWNIDYLTGVKKQLKKKNSFWEKYYARDVESSYYENKSRIIGELCDKYQLSGSVLDLGANTGKYSEIFLKYAQRIISLERDPTCCEIIRNKISKCEDAHVAWQVVNADVVNPDPNLGWMNRERKSLLDRVSSDVVLSLGLTHHIYFTDSIDFIQQANMLANICTKYLFVEFIESEDEKVKIISCSNPTRLIGYGVDHFFESFKSQFELLERIKLKGTRELFLFKKK